MNLRDLEYLVAVANHGQFGRAAEACNASQPTLSTQIRKLENELGLELFERVARGVLLTAAGRQIVERARVVLSEADAIFGIARRMTDPGSASLRIGLFPTLAPYLLPHVVPVVRERFPGLELLLAEEKTHEILRQLKQGQLDAGVLALPLADDDLDWIELFEEEFVLAVPAKHALARRRRRVSVEALSDESILLLEDGHCLRDQALAVCHLAGASEREDFRSTSLETMRQMVAAGVGVTLLPRLAVEPPMPPASGIRLVEFTRPAPSRRIALGWRKSSAYRDFFPRLAESLRTLPRGLVRPSARGRAG